MGEGGWRKPGTRRRCYRAALVREVQIALVPENISNPPCWKPYSPADPCGRERKGCGPGPEAMYSASYAILNGRVRRPPTMRVPEVAFCCQRLVISSGKPNLHLDTGAEAWSARPYPRPHVILFKGSESNMSHPLYLGIKYYIHLVIYLPCHCITQDSRELPNC
ncbi:hypothetical protein LY76DRAFT_411694 [Colletotrichum caudatum]|nr:hypothetical protein LY76DRAFT_411694 [Colletotrichum caudatum]